MPTPTDALPLTLAQSDQHATQSRLASHPGAPSAARLLTRVLIQIKARNPIMRFDFTIVGRRCDQALSDGDLAHAIGSRRNMSVGVGSRPCIQRDDMTAWKLSK